MEKKHEEKVFLKSLRRENIYKERPRAATNDSFYKSQNSNKKNGDDKKIF